MRVLGKERGSRREENGPVSPDLEIRLMLLRFGVLRKIARRESRVQNEQVTSVHTAEAGETPGAIAAEASLEVGASEAVAADANGDGAMS